MAEVGWNTCKNIRSHARHQDCRPSMSCDGNERLISYFYNRFDNILFLSKYSYHPFCKNTKLQQWRKLNSQCTLPFRWKKKMELTVSILDPTKIKASQRCFWGHLWFYASLWLCFRDFQPLGYIKSQHWGIMAKDH